MQKKIRHAPFQLVVGLEDVSELELLLERALSLSIWAPTTISTAEILKRFGTEFPLPKNYFFQKMLLFSSYDSKDLSLLVDEIIRHDINAYTSPVF